MARARKNAGLDRGETLARSARWLVEVAGVEAPPASPADTNANDLDAAMVRDVGWLGALDHLPVDGRPWVWARRVVSARRGDRDV